MILVTEYLFSAFHVDFYGYLLAVTVYLLILTVKGYTKQVSIFMSWGRRMFRIGMGKLIFLVEILDVVPTIRNGFNTSLEFCQLLACIIFIFFTSYMLHAFSLMLYLTLLI